MTHWLGWLAVSAFALSLSYVWMLSLLGRHYIYRHRWLSLHSDDRFCMRLLIDSYTAIVVAFLISLAGTGEPRRRSMILSGGAILFCPLAVVLLVYLS